MDQPTFATIDLTVSKYAAIEHISPEMLTLTVDREGIFDMVVARLVRSVATITGKETITVPEGWLDAWLMENAQRRRAPLTRALVRLIVSRRPIRTRVYHAEMYLPDVPLPRRGEYTYRVASWQPDYSLD